MNYYLPKEMQLKGAMEKGLIVPGNFLGKLECVRLLTKGEMAEWDVFRKSRAREIVRNEEGRDLLSRGGQAAALKLRNK